MMVTFLHITGHGLKGANLVPLSGTYWFVLLINTFSIVAVNCFVLITGYFLSIGTVKFKKLIMLWLQVWMYSVGIYLCLCVIPGTGVVFEFKQFVKCGLPLLTNQYWFFKCYVLLYLIAPILNILIREFNKEMYQKVLFLLLIIFSGIPSVNIFGDTFGTNGGYSLTWFAVLYLVAGYIRRYPLQLTFNPIWIYIGSCLVLCIVRLVGNLGNSVITTVAQLQLQYNGPLVFIASTALLLCCTFVNRNFALPAQSIIQRVSSATFGVYLVHDHGILSPIIWNDWARLTDTVNHPPAFVVRCILTLLILFMSGLVVEWVRYGIVNSIMLIVRRKH